MEGRFDQRTACRHAAASRWVVPLCCTALRCPHVTHPSLLLNPCPLCTAHVLPPCTCSHGPVEASSHVETTLTQCVQEFVVAAQVGSTTAVQYSTNQPMAVRLSGGGVVTATV